LNILVALIVLVVGLVLLIGGADALIKASASLAKRLGVSDFVVGVTVVAFGTSAPELFASVGATLEGRPDLAVGNVVGSNIANILLILGAGALMAPIVMTRRVRFVEIPVMVGVTALAMVFMLNDSVGRIEGGLLVAGLVAYVVFAVKGGAVDPADALSETLPAEGSVRRDIIVVAIGVVALGLGTRAVVLGAVAIAERAGVPEGVIGTTIVAFGTSLPELAATVRAAIAKKSDIAVGNIVGSNVFNVLSVLGICALVKPLAVSDAMTPSIFAMGAVTLALLVFSVSRSVIGRVSGGIFLAAYLAYVIGAYRAGPPQNDEALASRPPVRPMITAEVWASLGRPAESCCECPSPKPNRA
jgi:cation:H+ antiporter